MIDLIQCYPQRIYKSRPETLKCTNYDLKVAGNSEYKKRD